MQEYKIFIWYIFLCAILATIIYLLSYLFIVQEPDNEKISAYECGFYPFEDARNIVEVKFYLVAILFIIFDIEIIYLFPWAVILKQIDIFGYISILWFLIILTIGFLYEWKKGGLNWN